MAISVVTIKSVSTGLYLGLGSEISPNQTWSVQGFENKSKNTDNNLKWTIKADLNDPWSTTDIVHTFGSPKTSLIPGDTIAIDGHSANLAIAGSDNYLPPLQNFGFLKIKTINDKIAYKILIYGTETFSLYTDKSKSNNFYYVNEDEINFAVEGNNLFFVDFTSII
ncbi:hypothetical protein ACFQ3K_15750 [Brucella gallinifaecis]|uniref:Uncharacterized protein n=1 Tax=Brucella gallinifaecis TaxID=215590 RepID=A0A502BNX4_9HYPH|nr:hypothetical protein [Brucella gallinifaecis]TPF74996.1 hypothetical protein FHY56_11735 [Brucella gallinifaecis]